MRTLEPVTAVDYKFLVDYTHNMSMIIMSALIHCRHAAIGPGAVDESVTSKREGLAELVCGASILLRCPGRRRAIATDAQRMRNGRR